MRALEVCLLICIDKSMYNLKYLIFFVNLYIQTVPATKADNMLCMRQAVVILDLIQKFNIHYQITQKYSP